MKKVGVIQLQKLTMEDKASTARRKKGSISCMALSTPILDHSMQNCETPLLCFCFKSLVCVSLREKKKALEINAAAE